MCTHAPPSISPNCQHLLEAVTQPAPLAFCGSTAVAQQQPYTAALNNEAHPPRQNVLMQVLKSCYVMLERLGG